MRNPFVYGEEAADEAFCNRRGEIKELLRDIGNSVNVIIFSPRRYGKTSLIKQALKQLDRRRTVAVYVDLYPAVSKQKFLELYAAAVSKALTGKAEAKLKLLKELFPRLIPKLVIRGEAGAPEFEFDFDRTKRVSLYLEDLLQAVKKYADRHGVNAVVVFDEIQEILQYEDDEIEKSMRTAFQGHRNVSYIFLGSKRHLMEPMFTDPNRPFYKSGKHLPLKRIAAEELASFILEKFQQGRFKISSRNAARIVELAECHPYYVQLLCHVLWNDHLDTRKIGEAEIAGAMARVIDRERSLFVALWDGLTRKQKALLLAFAQSSERKIFSHRFLAEHNLGSASSMQKALTALIEKNLVERENGAFVLSDVFFKRWLQNFA
jgi:hypothetical protein